MPKHQAPKEIADRRAEFRRRISEDRKQYSDEQLGEIETLYQAANEQWNTPEAKESLKTLMEKHPKANRAGCAVLYLAQMSDGEERDKLLKLAIGGYGDCFYGNGVRVGSCARWYLAFCYKGKGMHNEAQALFDEIKRDYPEAINHRGHRMTDIMAGMSKC